MNFTKQRRVLATLKIEKNENIGFLTYYIPEAITKVRRYNPEVLTYRKPMVIVL
jgi:hypothetical protein